MMHETTPWLTRNAQRSTAAAWVVHQKSRQDYIDQKQTNDDILIDIYPI
jgi:hypothetical protein